MAQGSESDYRLSPSIIASTLSVLNPMNNDLKNFGHGIAFALHSIDWSPRRVFSATNNGFIIHKLDKIKYPVLHNKIVELENKLHYRINLFLLMILLDISDTLSIFQNAITLKK